jgi:hypothetical protein
MDIEDPHGVTNIMPALTQDQRDSEECEFRILSCSYMVQMYGTQLQMHLSVPYGQRDNGMVDMLKFNMNAMQRFAVRMNKRYEYLQNKMKLGKLS